MTGIFNTRILASIAMLVFVGAVVASSTGAFFSDTETSTGNTFTAGSLDLKVDSEAHYNGLICRLDNNVPPEYRWLEPVGTPLPSPLQVLEHYNTAGDGTWTETDLGAHDEMFFNIEDVKP